MAQPPGAENGPTLRRLSRPAAKITLFGSGYAGLGDWRGALSHLGRD